MSSYTPPAAAAARTARANRRSATALLVLAVAAVAWSVARAGVANVFPHDWWRLW